MRDHWRKSISQAKRLKSPYYNEDKVRELFEAYKKYPNITMFANAIHASDNSLINAFKRFMAREYRQVIKDKRSEAHKGKHHSPHTEIKKGQHLSPETQFKLGHVPWSRKPDVTIICHTCAEAFQVIPSHAKTAKYCSRECQHRSRERARKISHALKARKFPATHRKHLSEAMKGREAWNKGKKRPWLSQLNKDPDFIRKRFEGALKKPTKPEEKLIKIISEHNLPFHYVGNGSKIIGSFNPDFVHNTQSKVVEVFGRLYHDPEFSSFDIPIYHTKTGRQAIFRKLGYDCLIIWEDELQNEQSLVEKIQNFCGK